MPNPNLSSVCILGIDPGYDRVGWSVAIQEKQTFSLLSAGCIQTNKKHTLFERYQQILVELTQILTEYHPTELAIETLFFAKNKSTALTVSEARGVIIATALSHNCAIFEYSPNQVKLTVAGTASADKAAVAKMIRYQIKTPIESKLIDDAMDAIGISLTHAIQRRLHFPLS